MVFLHLFNSVNDQQISYYVYQKRGNDKGEPNFAYLKD